MKKLILFTLLFFILLFISYLLEMTGGAWVLWIDIPLFFFFLVLCGSLFYQVYVLIKNRFRDLQRIVTIVFMTCILAFSVAVVTNDIKIDRLYGKDIFVASSMNGDGDGRAILRLKDGGLFMYESFSFTRSWNVGKYTIDHDTIYFSYNKRGGHHYSFAIIEKDSIYSDKPGLKIFQDKEDTDPMFLPIIKNNTGLK